jgi:hypothetical protein
MGKGVGGSAKGSQKCGYRVVLYGSGDPLEKRIQD